LSTPRRSRRWLEEERSSAACIKFAADHPDRVAGLILFASLAKRSATPDYPHALQAS
jgi:hypothetical protein